MCPLINVEKIKIIILILLKHLLWITTLIFQLTFLNEWYTCNILTIRVWNNNWTNKGKEVVSLQLAKSKFSQDETKVNWNTKARCEEGTSGSIR